MSGFAQKMTTLSPLSSEYSIIGSWISFIKQVFPVPTFPINRVGDSKQFPSSKIRLCCSFTIGPLPVVLHAGTVFRSSFPSINFFNISTFPLMKKYFHQTQIKLFLCLMPSMTAITSARKTAMASA